MKIIILGAGQVGSTIAEYLAREGNEVTVVDRSSAALESLADRIDLRVVRGNAAHPDVLKNAGAEDADMVIALTDSDEVNMIASQVAYTLFQTPTKVARIRAPEYLDHPEMFSNEFIPIDLPISPEALITRYIQRLIQYPGALQVLNFADGRVQLVAVRAEADGPLVGHEVRTLRDHIPGAKTRIAAVFRRDKPIIPTGDTVIEVDDEVFFVAARRDIKRMMAEFSKVEKPASRVTLAGFGHIGLSLARALENNYHVTIIERSREHVKRQAEHIGKSTVVIGDCTDDAVLRGVEIQNTDIYAALTNSDEANILSSLMAKRMGAGKVLTLINRPAFVDLVESGVDIAISPQQITIGTLLAHVRRGHVVNVHSLRRGAAEAIEVVAHGDQRSSRVVGRAIGDVDLPEGTTIGAIVRQEEVVIPHQSTEIEPDDHVILFVVDKQHIREVEKLFHVGATFL
jgi:trk system potassium uptake protein TrkA